MACRDSGKTTHDFRNSFVWSPPRGLMLDVVKANLMRELGKKKKKPETKRILEKDRHEWLES